MPPPSAVIDPTTPPRLLRDARNPLALLERWQLRLTQVRTTGNRGWLTLTLEARHLDGAARDKANASSLHLRVLDQRGVPMPIQQVVAGTPEQFTVTITVVSGSSAQGVQLRPASLLVYTAQSGVKWPLKN